jgi:hypothetical protein
VAPSDPKALEESAHKKVGSSVCPFARVAPAGVSCPVSGMMAAVPDISLETSAAASVEGASVGPANPLIADVAEEIAADEAAASVVAVSQARRCPWWARLLRYTAKAVAKHVIMRQLKPVMRRSFGAAFVLVKNIRGAGGGVGVGVGDVVSAIVPSCPMGYK